MAVRVYSRHIHSGRPHVITHWSSGQHNPAPTLRGPDKVFYLSLGNRLMHRMAQTLSLTHAHRRTDTPPLTYSLSHTHTHILSLSHTHTHTLSHTRTHPGGSFFICVCVLMCVCVCVCVYMCVCLSAGGSRTRCGLQCEHC